MEGPSSHITKATNSDPGGGSEGGSPRSDFGIGGSKDEF